MNKELTQQLVNRFPYIQNEENIGLQWGSGIDVGDGWYDLTYKLLEKIEQIYGSNNVDISEFKVIQIKEKYAELRFYASSSLRAVHDLINEYENLSTSICDECGKEGSLHRLGGYLLTLCDECAERKGFRKTE